MNTADTQLQPGVGKRLTIDYQADVIDEIAADFALRPNNQRALHALVETLASDYDPAVELIMDMATGAGKTYLMAAFIEYLRRSGVGTVLIVTPGDIVHGKTVANFTPGHHRYIGGVPEVSAPRVFYPGSYTEWGYAKAEGQFEFGNPVNLFVLNVHQLLAPSDLEGTTKGSTQEAEQRTIRRYNEIWGNVYQDLQSLDDLVVIVDETHIISESAEKYTAAIQELAPAAVIGLTASVVPKGVPTRTVFRYPLWQAIEDGHVKTPVIALRRGGYVTKDGSINEEQQLRDALVLRTLKEKVYGEYALTHGKTPITPVLLVNCQDTTHAAEIRSLLSSPGFLGSADAVLQIDNTTKKDVGVRERLDNLDQPDSPVRAVVSVDMLKEGWDSKSVAVLCSLRASASQVLTQQTMGRGLRLPFGVVTGHPLIDQLDIISHKAFESALKDEGVLKSFGLEETVREAGQRPIIKAGIGEGTRTPNARDGEDHTHDGTGPYGQPEGGSRDTLPDSGVDGGSSPGAASGGFSAAAGGAAGAGAAGRPGGVSGSTSGVGMYELDLFGYEDTDTEPVEPVTYMVNTAFEETTFTFPASRLVVGEPLEFSPAQISTDVLQQKARTASDSGETIERHRLTIPNPKLRRIIAQRTKDATTASEAISYEDARDVIITGLRKSSKVPRTSSKSWLKLVEGRVEVFMDAVVVDWTVNSAASAADIFTDVYVAALREHAKRSQVTRTQVVPVTVPVYQTIVVPAGVEVLPRSDDARGFLPGQPYGLYEQSIFPIAYFDAYSTEYRIAELLEAAPDVTWWKRLDQSRDRDAHISVTPTNLYFPDFIVYEEETNTYYIVEGKRSDEVDSAIVQEKATATREVFAYLPQHDEFAGQTWKYLLISEKDIAQAGSWTGLKVHAKS